MLFVEQLTVELCASCGQLGLATGVQMSQAAPGYERDRFKTFTARARSTETARRVEIVHNASIRAARAQQQRDTSAGPSAVD